MRKMSNNNTTGHRGVVPARKGRRFSAQISIKSRTKYLGTFDTPEEAAAAYQAAAKERA